MAPFHRIPGLDPSVFLSLYLSSLDQIREIAYNRPWFNMSEKYKILRSAEKHVLSGKVASAIREYQKLLTKEPDEPTLLNTVGDLLLRHNSREEALGYFSRAAEVYLRSGFLVKAIAVFKKIYSLNPSDTAINEKLADLYQRQGLVYEAVKHLSQLVQYYELQNDLSQASLYLERVVEMNPGDPSLQVHLAENLQKRQETAGAFQHYQSAAGLYLNTEQYEDAFQTAQRAIDIDSTDDRMLDTFVSAALRTNRGDLVKALLESQIQKTGQRVPYEIFLAQILEEEGDRVGAYARFAQIEPIAFGDSRVREGLARTAPVEELLAGSAKGAEARPTPAPGAPQTVSFEPAASGSGLFDADIGSGLFAEPAAQGSGVFELDLAKGTEDWMGGAAAPTAAPADAQSDSMFEVSGLGEVSSFASTPDARTETGTAGIFDIAGGDTMPADFLWKPPALEPITEEEEEEEVFEEPAAEELPQTELDESPIESLDEALQEADFYLKLGFREEAKKLLERLLHTYPRDERVRRRAEKVMSIPPELEEAEPAPLQLISPEELEIDLGQEMDPELFKPEGPAAPIDLHKLSDEGEQSDEEAGFDLEVDSALDSLFTGDGSEAPIEEVLRYDVASSSSGDEAANPKVHYDLGLAYKEMGLIEDAIQEFQAAVQLLVDPANNPQKILCYSMLANSFLQTGRYSDAMQCAEEGLRVPGQKEFEWKALKYDLCTAQAKQGDNEQAVNGFQEILARDPNYRDVKQRVEHLLQAHG